MKKDKLNTTFKAVLLGVAIVFVSSKISLINGTFNDVYGQSNVATYTDFSDESTEPTEITGKIEDGVQVIEFNMQNSAYPTLNVKAGVPVKLIINTDEDNLNSCNFRIISQDFGIQQQLNYGQNIIEFTPTEAGQYTYSCWMGMVSAYINVYDEDITPSAIYDENNIALGGCCG